MQEWDEDSEQAARIARDTEKARSLLKLIEMREKDLEKKNDEFATLIIEGYYGIVKELITSIMSIDGWKTVSHELLVGYLAKHYREFSDAEIFFIDQLRKTRNDIAYRGAMIQPEYLKRNKARILAIIAKLKGTVLDKLRH